MKKLLIVFLFLSNAAFIGDESVSSLNGAYKMSKMKYQNDKDWVTADDRFSIKVFKNGYWFSGALKKAIQSSAACTVAPTILKTANTTNTLIFIRGILPQLALR